MNITHIFDLSIALKQYQELPMKEGLQMMRSLARYDLISSVKEGMTTKAWCTAYDWLSHIKEIKGIPSLKHIKPLGNASTTKGNEIIKNMPMQTVTGVEYPMNDQIEAS